MLRIHPYIDIGAVHERNPQKGNNHQTYTVRHKSGNGFYHTFYGCVPTCFRCILQGKEKQGTQTDCKEEETIYQCIGQKALSKMLTIVNRVEHLSISDRQVLINRNAYIRSCSNHWSLPVTFFTVTVITVGLVQCFTFRKYGIRLFR